MKRISKHLAEAGYCSRREADDWIEKGWVFVNGVRAILGQKVSEEDEVTLDQKAQRDRSSKRTILLHKPVGFVSSQPEKDYRPAITLLTFENHSRIASQPPPKSSREIQKDMAVAGRLDIDSRGLLVFTQDGHLAKMLIGPNSTIEKEYHVRFEGQVEENQLKLLRHGLSLDDQPLKPAKVTLLEPGLLRFVLIEGKKRQIRRMCEAVGLRVVDLKRVRIGNVLLGSLEEGRWRYLQPSEHF